MPIKLYNPTTSGRRKASVQDFSDITKKSPERSLIKRIQPKSGRTNTGNITVRHRGGGEKQLYRIVDFSQNVYDVPAVVKAIEYDPYRGPRIALIEYQDGVKAYILAPLGFKVGDTVVSSKGLIEAKVGARMPLKYIPVGMFVHNIELSSGQGGKIVRGAGVGAQFQTLEGGRAQLKLPSGEVRMVSEACRASVGQVGNVDYKLVRIGKAGRKRHMGWRPTVRGKAMNPVDHPHGGGEGHNPIGLKGGPKTPWGRLAMGVKTRKPNRPSDKLIIKRRK